MTSGSARSPFSVRFWGVRGTIPCPGAGTLRYGGNTPCVEVTCGEHRLVFDAGTGLRRLGQTLLANGHTVTSHVFLTHTHLDHVNGLPFFRPAYDGRNRFEFWAGHLTPQRRRLDEVLGTLMQAPFFPVPFDIMHACIAFHDFQAGDELTPLADVKIKTAALRHPGGATGYRVEFDSRAFAYITDTEHDGDRLDENILRLIDGADLVVYDATYTEAEMETHRGWGHSSWQQGLRLMEEAAADRFVAFHHDPDHDDQRLDAIASEMAGHRDRAIMAVEGEVIEL